MVSKPFKLFAVHAIVPNGRRREWMGTRGGSQSFGHRINCLPKQFFGGG
jgi:hypothetical protein